MTSMSKPINQAGVTTECAQTMVRGLYAPEVVHCPQKSWRIPSFQKKV
jgi:hypothetical protein